jgi:hypothetical protein
LRRWRLRGLVAPAIARNSIHLSSPKDPENRTRPRVGGFPPLIEEELPTVATTNVDGR